MSIYKSTPTYILLILAALFFMGCRKNQPTDRAVQIIEIDPEKAGTLRYSDLFALKKFVFFNDTNQIVSNIEKVVWQDNLIALQCGRPINKLYLKDMESGTTITLGRKGKGPGQYRSLTNFFMDTPNKKIWVLDGRQGKFFIYSMPDGHLIREITDKQLIFAQSFFVMGDIVAVYGGVSFFGNHQHRLIFFDTQTHEVVARYFPITPAENNYMYFIEQDNFTTDSLFHYKFNNDFYRISRVDGQYLSKALSFSFGSATLPKEILQKEYADVRVFNEYCKTTAYAYGIANVLSWPDKIFFTFHYKDSWPHLIYDKSSGQQVLYNKVINDLFGIPVKTPASYSTIPRGSSKETIIFAIEPAEEKTKLKKLRGSLPSDQWQAIYTQNRKLIDLYDSLKYDDNSFLVMLQFKNQTL